MQYILSEEEYQRYRDALKDAEAARSNAAKLAEYLAARDAGYLSAFQSETLRKAPEVHRECTRIGIDRERKLLATWKRRDPLFYQRKLAQIAAVYEDSAEE